MTSMTGTEGITRMLSVGVGVAVELFSRGTDEWLSLGLVPRRSYPRATNGRTTL
jgi:hypothetical protein